MRTLSCSKMKQAIEKILRARGLLEEFNQGAEFAVRIQNAPYLPLTIERHGHQVTVTHYIRENGDSIPDPDMQFEFVGDEWLPVAIQFSTGYYRRAMEIRDGRRFVNRRETHDQIQFSRMWAQNLIDQGFAAGQVERIAG